MKAGPGGLVRLGSPVGDLLAALAVTALFVAATLAFPGGFDRLDFMLSDARLNLAPGAAPSPDVVLVDIDDRAVNRLGRWPFSRSVQARVLDSLTALDPALVVYDVLFKGRADPAGDAAFAGAIAKSGRVLLPCGFALVHEPEVIGLELDPGDVPLADSVLALRTPDLARLWQADRTVAPLADFSRPALALGQISAIPEADGVYRRMAMVAGFDGRPFPALSLAAAIRFMDADSLAWDGTDLVLRTPRGLKRRLPLDERGMMVVDFSATWDKGFEHVGFMDLYDLADHPESAASYRELVAGKIVLVGLSASGTVDYGPTPLSRSEPLVMVHANAISAILQNSFIRPAPWMGWAAAAVLMAVIAFLRRVFPPGRFIAVSLAVLMVYAGADYALFSLARTAAPLARPLLAALVFFLSLAGIGYFTIFVENLRRKREQEKMAAQLEAASRIQTHFWPKLPELPGGAGVFAVSKPAIFVGGDLYDVIPLADGSYIIYAADVSGKGLPASLVMAAAWAEIRSQVRTDRDIRDILAWSNAKLFDFLAREGNFITALFTRFHPESGRLEFIDAGHMPPFHITPQGRKPTPKAKCMPLGIDPEAEYLKAEIVLASGESVIMPSDGVTEAENTAKELFGDDRVAAFCARNPGPPWGPGIIESVDRWRKGTDPNDDTTLIEIWMAPR